MERFKTCFFYKKNMRFKTCFKTRFKTSCFKRANPGEDTSKISNKSHYFLT